MADIAPREGPHRAERGPEILVGDLLPVEDGSPASKASFTDMLWGEASRAFAAAWDGSGLDSSLVDPDELRRVLARAHPGLPLGHRISGRLARKSGRQSD